MCHFLGVAYCVILSQKGNVTILDAWSFLGFPSWEDLGYEMNSESPVLAIEHGWKHLAESEVSKRKEILKVECFGVFSYQKN